MNKMNKQVSKAVNALTEVLYILEHGGVFCDKKMIEEALKNLGLSQSNIDYYKARSE